MNAPKCYKSALFLICMLHVNINLRVRDFNMILFEELINFLIHQMHVGKRSSMELM